MKLKTLTRAIAMSVGIMTTPFVLADLNDGLVAYYPFDGNANDESSNRHDGTVNGPTLTEDRFGNANSAYSFDGVNDFIEIANSDTLEIGYHDYTIAAWIKTVPNNNGRIFSKGSSGCVTGYMMRMGGTQGSKLYLENAKDGTCEIVATGNVTINDNAWHFVVGVVDRDIGAKIYVDSNLDVQVNHDTSMHDLSNNNNPMIGFNDVGDYYEPFNGVIDDVRIYNRALSEEEIQTLYTSVPNEEDCQHATYTPKKRTLTIPVIEIPVIDFLTGQATDAVEQWTGTLKQVLGTTNRFRLLPKTLALISDGSSSSCPATYAIETGTLSIPYIDVPTGIAVGPKEFENGVEVFKATLTWDAIGRSFIVQEVESTTDNSPQIAQSCLAIKTNDSSATDGIYQIDPDGTGSIQPFKVYCDMSSDDGGWTLIFRHDASAGYFSGIHEASNVNQNTPGLSTKKYSILNQLDAFKRDGKFQFRINWPGYTKKNIWSQTSNPTEDVNVAGYQAISVDASSNYWGGLEFGNGSLGPTNVNYSYLDGSVNHDNWYYAIGSYKQWGTTEGCYNAIPAADEVAGYYCGVQSVELWVK